jgi:hypothetical protein
LLLSIRPTTDTTHISPCCDCVMERVSVPVPVLVAILIS